MSSAATTSWPHESTPNRSGSNSAAARSTMRPERSRPAVDLRQRLAADQASLTASRLRLGELEDRDREWREQLAQLRESARAAAQAVADAEAVESRSQAVLAAVAWAQQIQQLAAAEAAASEAERRLRSARQQADAILVTDGRAAGNPQRRQPPRPRRSTASRRRDARHVRLPTRATGRRGGR